MEGAFTHVGNHLLSDSAAAIKAADNDDLSTIDPDENLLFDKYGGGADLDSAGGGSVTRRSHDEDDNATETFDDADSESIVSAAADGVQGLGLEAEAEEEEKELPAHACAYVSWLLSFAEYAFLLFCC